MQLSSSGAKTATRVAAHLRNKPGGARAIHIPTFARPHPHPPTSPRFVAQTRNFISSFYAHLTAPEVSSKTSAYQTGEHLVRLHTRSIHTNFGLQHGKAGIHQRLSFPVRHALRRPLGSTFLPRPPAIPRNTTQVGLGLHRNFSSGRPIFENLVDNVPIIGRAFWEADWELKMQEERKKKIPKYQPRKAEKKYRKEMLKPTTKKLVARTPSPTNESEFEAELNHFFSSTQSHEVVTCLLIPLAPTPTERLPLSTRPPDTYRHRLPLNAIGSMHADHALHSIRVSSLFARLDAADVWTQRVTCSAYSHHYPGESSSKDVCTVLKIEFAGWTKEQVRAVIGESGTGWCLLEEMWPGDQTPNSDQCSETSSEASGGLIDGMDPSQYFVLPAVDFSSAFLSNTMADQPSPVHESTETGSDSDWELDYYSSDSGSEFSNESSSWIDSPSEAGSGSTWFGVGFSSDFASRAWSEEEPREAVFY